MLELEEGLVKEITPRMKAYKERERVRSRNRILTPEQKARKAEHTKVWRAENRDIIRARRKIYTASHKEEKAEYDKNNKDRRRENYKKNAVARRAYMKKYREDHPETYAKWKRTQRTNQLKDPTAYVMQMLHNAKNRAKRKGLDFDLELDKIHWPTHCPVFGIEFTYLLSDAGNRWDAPSLDRVDNSKGYTLDNVQVISYKANAMKRDGSEEELKMFANWILAQE